MIIKTREYTDVLTYAHEWVKGTFRNLYVMGIPGSGKTHAIREALKSEPRSVVWDGHISPKRLYQLLREWQNRGVRLVVFDDIQAVTKNDAIAGLLKQAMGENGDKEQQTVSWASTQEVDEESIKVDMRFCIITNDIGTRNHHVRALQSRSMTLMHNPTAQQTLDYAEASKIITYGMKMAIERVGYPASGYIDLRLLRRLRTIMDMKQDWETIYQDNLSRS